MHPIVPSIDHMVIPGKMDHTIRINNCFWAELLWQIEPAWKNNLRSST